MKKIILLILAGFILSPMAFSQSSGQAGRMKEVFKVTELTKKSSPNTRFLDPWEVTYGPDDSLWITESKGYKVYKLSPGGGTPRIVLNISQNATFLPVADRVWNLQFNFSGQGNPQGGLAGLAIHPKFNDPSNPQPYVFVSYIYKYVSTGSGNSGVFFKNAIVRFKYENGQLDSPYMVCDTLPGSSDHNSQRMIIAPDNGKYYLFYANGDMGAGQFGNQYRTENAQNLNSYEGKILRFNIDPDGDAGTYDRWIPSGGGNDSNPFNGTNGIVQSAVWALGIRNNQGFAYVNINGVDRLYGQSHGPFSDDEINILQRSGNYGHPLVIGYSWDGNYDSAAAGNSVRFGGSLPTIVSEKANALALTNYHDPIYTFYPALKGDTGTTLAHNAKNSATNTVQRMYWDFNHGSQGNGAWPSESPSGLDVYTNSMIPGWKNSLLSATLKGAPGGGGGKIIRSKLTASGDGVDTTSIHNTDTVGYFISTNRYRDVAISADGLNIFAIIDSSQTTSGPTSTNPINSACKGCLYKFTFLGYADDGAGHSTMPDTIPIAVGGSNTCTLANTVNISAANGNNNLWVPITDANSNIVAEIYANGNDLGAVTTSFYENTGSVREVGFFKNLYLDRNITITPTNQPAVSKPVSVKLYITSSEYNALKNAHNSKGNPSGVININSVGIFKNHDVCGPTYSSAPTALSTTAFTRTTGAGNNGYAVQASVTSFSTFYFANVTATLPVYLISFTGSISNDIARLQWVTENETDTKDFVVERSTDGSNFDSIGTVMAAGISGKYTYNYPDDVSKLTTPSVYYRLKMVDADGQFKYSNIVDLPLPGAAGTLTVRPNPVANILNVDLNAINNDNAVWQILDNSGRVLLQGNTTIQKGPNTFSIQVGKLQRGIYFLKVMGSSISQGIKVEKL